MARPFASSHYRVYFVVSSKNGSASIEVEHRAGSQSLLLPVYPSNAVPEALPYIDPVFAHYVAQWEKVTVPDPDDTDARGFYLEASDVPQLIAPWENEATLADIATAHAPAATVYFFGGRIKALGPPMPHPGNDGEFCVAATRAGITPYVAD